MRDPQPIKSSIDGIGWPAVPEPYAARLLSVLHQLEKSQWWQADRLQDFQLEQLQVLLDHAYRTIPFHRERLARTGYLPGEPLTWDAWQRIPMIGKSDIQELGDQLLTNKLPESHGNLIELKTSGSTGQPILVKGTDVTAFFWNALTLRDHLWHKRDLSGKLASIRIRPGGLTNLSADGTTVPDWGFPVNAVFRTGPAVLLDINTAIRDQASWLVEHRPDSILTHPTNVKALAEYFLENSLRLDRLKEIRTFGEMVDPGLRKLCQKVWNVPLIDMYSAHEVGYMALQCPEHPHYHVQSEVVLIEVLDEKDRQCAPGEIGRIVDLELAGQRGPTCASRSLASS